jgi:hypothetical protein
MVESAVLLELEDMPSLELEEPSSSSKASVCRNLI